MNSTNLLELVLSYSVNSSFKLIMMIAGHGHGPEVARRS